MSFVKLYRIGQVSAVLGPLLFLVGLSYTTLAYRPATFVFGIADGLAYAGIAIAFFGGLILIHERKQARLAIRWRKITGRTYEYFPITEEERDWMITKKWAEERFLVPFARKALDAFDEKDRKQSLAIDEEVELSMLGVAQKKGMEEIKDPKEFVARRDKNSEKYRFLLDRVVIAQQSLRNSQAWADERSKNFHKAWDFFKDLLGTTPVNPKTGKPFEGKDAPKQFLEYVRSLKPTEVDTVLPGGDGPQPAKPAVPQSHGCGIHISD